MREIRGFRRAFCDPSPESNAREGWRISLVLVIRFTALA